MRNLAPIAILAFSFILSPCTTAAAEESHVFVPKRAADFWTPERYADARPMPLQEVDISLLRSEKPLDEKALIGADTEPFEEIFPSFAEEPNLDSNQRALFAKRLFPVEMIDRAIEAGEEPQGSMLKNRGTLNLFNYTSSRLIPAEAASVFPYSAVGRLFFSNSSGATFSCSAAVITKRLVITAGHCVDDGAFGGPYENFSFVPAYDRGNAPFGEWEVSTVFASPSWAANGTIPHDEDWALLEMTDQSGERIADVTGKLSFIAEKLENNHLTMLGYPGNFDSGQEMHQVQSGDYGFSTGSNTVLYGNDMGGGSSGGPWVQNFNRKSVGQNGGRNRARAAVVGVASYSIGFDAGWRIQGASVLTRDFKILRQEACFHQTGNC